MDKAEMIVTINLDHARQACAMANNEFVSEWNKKSDDEVLSTIFKHMKTGGAIEWKLNEKRPKGKWIISDDYETPNFVCSQCGEVSCCSGNFCPDCGADMREDAEEIVNSTYQKELSDVRHSLLNRPDQYIAFRDLVERFDEVDTEFNHSPWNLLQIYNNFDILIGIESEGKE